MAWQRRGNKYRKKPRQASKSYEEQAEERRQRQKELSEEERPPQSYPSWTHILY